MGAADVPLLSYCVSSQTFCNTFQAIAEAEAAGVDPPPPRMPSPYMYMLPPTEFMARVLRGIRSSEVEEALLLLPFHCLGSLLFYVSFGVLRMY